MIISNASTIIEINNLIKNFNNKQVLTGVNLTIPDKSIFSILGRSGTGKSVLIKCIINILSADSGEIWYKGFDLASKNKKIKKQKNILLKDFAYLFQESALFDSLTVKENIAFPLKEVLGINDKKYINKRVAELLEWVELPNTENLMPSELSGGMKKRTSFARTLATNPKIMLCDEPTTGLDPVTGKTIMDLIVRANKAFDITFIVISHNVTESIRTADYISFLDKGFIQTVSDAQGFMKEDYPTLQDFITHSLVNVAEMKDKKYTT